MDLVVESAKAVGRGGLDVKGEAGTDALAEPTPLSGTVTTPTAGDGDDDGAPRLMETFAMDIQSTQIVADWIGQLKQFKELSADERKRMAAGLVPMRCKPGYTLVHEGHVVGVEDNGDMYFVYSGECVVTRAYTESEIQVIQEEKAAEEERRRALQRGPSARTLKAEREAKERAERRAKERADKEAAKRRRRGSGSRAVTGRGAALAEDPSARRRRSRGSISSITEGETAALIAMAKTRTAPGRRRSISMDTAGDSAEDGSGTEGGGGMTMGALLKKVAPTRYEVPETDKYLATLLPGKYFGELAPNGRRRNANVIAGTECIIFAMNRANQGIFFDASVSEEMASLHKLRRSCSCPAGQRSEQDLDRLEALCEDIEFFQALSRTVLRDLCQTMQYVSFDKGKRVFQQGDVGVTLYIIISGRIDLTMSDIAGVADKGNIRSKALNLKRAIKIGALAAHASESHEKQLDSLSAGDSFGEMALVDRNHRRKYTARAKEFTETMVINVSQYDKTLTKDGAMHLRDKLAFARSLPLFTSKASSLDAQTLNKACCYLQERRYAKGAVLLREDEDSSSINFIVSGNVAVLKHCTQGEADVWLNEDGIRATDGPGGDGKSRAGTELSDAESGFHAPKEAEVVVDGTGAGIGGGAGDGGDGKDDGGGDGKDGSGDKDGGAGGGAAGTGGARARKKAQGDSSNPFRHVRVPLPSHLTVANLGIGEQFGCGEDAGGSRGGGGRSGGTGSRRSGASGGDSSTRSAFTFQATEPVIILSMKRNVFERRVTGEIMRTLAAQEAAKRAFRLQRYEHQLESFRQRAEVAEAPKIMALPTVLQQQMQSQRGAGRHGRAPAASLAMTMSAGAPGAAHGGSPEKQTHRIARPKSAHLTGAPILRFTAQGTVISHKDKLTPSPLAPEHERTVSYPDAGVAWSAFYGGLRAGPAAQPLPQAIDVAAAIEAAQLAEAAALIDGQPSQLLDDGYGSGYEGDGDLGMPPPPGGFGGFGEIDGEGSVSTAMGPTGGRGVLSGSGSFATTASGIGRAGGSATMMMDARGASAEWGYYGSGSGMSASAFDGTASGASASSRPTGEGEYLVRPGTAPAARKARGKGSARPKSSHSARVSGAAPMSHLIPAEAKVARRAAAQGRPMSSIPKSRLSQSFGQRFDPWRYRDDVGTVSSWPLAGSLAQRSPPDPRGGGDLRRAAETLDLSPEPQYRPRPLTAPGKATHSKSLTPSTPMRIRGRAASAAPRAAGADGEWTAGYVSPTGGDASGEEDDGFGPRAIHEVFGSPTNSALSSPAMSRPGTSHGRPGPRRPGAAGNVAAGQSGVAPLALHAAVRSQAVRQSPVRAPVPSPSRRGYYTLRAQGALTGTDGSRAGGRRGRNGSGGITEQQVRSLTEGYTAELTHQSLRPDTPKWLTHRKALQREQRRFQKGIMGSSTGSKSSAGNGRPGASAPRGHAASRSGASAPTLRAVPGPTPEVDDAGAVNTADDSLFHDPMGYNFGQFVAPSTALDQAQLGQLGARSHGGEAVATAPPSVGVHGTSSPSALFYYDQDRAFTAKSSPAAAHPARGASVAGGGAAAALGSRVVVGPAGSPRTRTAHAAPGSVALPAGAVHQLAVSGGHGMVVTNAVVDAPSVDTGGGISTAAPVPGSEAAPGAMLAPDRAHPVTALRLEAVERYQNPHAAGVKDRADKEAMVRRRPGSGKLRKAGPIKPVLGDSITPLEPQASVSTVGSAMGGEGLVPIAGPRGSGADGRRSPGGDSPGIGLGITPEAGTGRTAALSPQARVGSASRKSKRRPPSAVSQRTEVEGWTTEAGGAPGGLEATFEDAAVEAQTSTLVADGGDAGTEGDPEADA